MKPHFRNVAVAFVLCTGVVSVHVPTVVGEPLRITPVETTGVRTVETVAARPVKRVAAPAVPARPASKAMTKATKSKIVPATRKVVVRKPVVARKAAAKPLSAVTLHRPVPVAEAVSLTPGQRSVLYRTIVREQIVPAPVITERIAPIAREPIVTAPAAPPVNAPLVTERIVPPVAATAPIIAGPQPTGPIATQRVITTPTYNIGARLPANVPLYAIPESAALQVPVVRRYSYAFINERVLLVEPFTGVVVAELDR